MIQVRERKEQPLGREVKAVRSKPEEVGREAVCVVVCACEYNWLCVCELSHRVGDDGTYRAQGTPHTWVLILLLPLSHLLVLGRSLRGLEPIFSVIKCVKWGLHGL